MKGQANETEAWDAMREAFLRTAADRLKTPVTSLGLALQRMEDVQTEEDRRQFFEMAKRGQQELSQAVETVLKTVFGEDEGGKDNETAKK